MKTAYSTYHNKSWKLFKLMYPRRTEQDYCEFAFKLWVKACSSRPQDKAGMEWDRDSMYVDNMIEFIWRFRKVKHYFLAPGVADFCESSVKEFSEDYCKRFPVCDPVDAPCDRNKWLFAAPLSFFGKGPKDKVQGAFAVHFPSKERQRSVMVIPDALIPVPPNEIPDNYTGRLGAKHYYFVANDGENTTLMQKSDPEDFGGDQESYRIPKLLFGLSLYMDAFPDSIVESRCDDVQHAHHYIGDKTIVNRNDIVDEEHRHSVIPHWRRVHVRMLSSSKFVHKHGQTVYVKGTFVKGCAFDVMEDTTSHTNNK